MKWTAKMKDYEEPEKKGYQPVWKHNQDKWKIVKKDTETPLIYNGRAMKFRTKYSMLQFYDKLKKDQLFDFEIEWSEI